MKTSVNIVRKLNDFDVVQRTKDGMFNATELLKQWNKSTKGKKEVYDFFDNKHTKDFINVLIQEENLNTGNLPYLKSRGNNGGTWMHPYLFIKFAMWLNPKFEYHVIKFVYDELLKHRHLSGDYYKKLCSLLSGFGTVDFSEVGRMLNYVIFNKHKKDLRNSATPEQQNDLQQLERDMCYCIEKGFVKSYDEFKQQMTNEWKTRYGKQPAVFANH